MKTWLGITIGVASLSVTALVINIFVQKNKNKLKDIEARNTLQNEKNKNNGKTFSAKYIGKELIVIFKEGNYKGRLHNNGVNYQGGADLGGNPNVYGISGSTNLLVTQAGGYENGLTRFELKEPIEISVNDVKDFKII